MGLLCVYWDGDGADLRTLGMTLGWSHRRGQLSYRHPLAFCVCHISAWFLSCIFLRDLAATMDVTRVARRAAEIAGGIHCTETRRVSIIPWQDSGHLPAHGWKQLENALPVDSVHGAELWVKDQLT